MELMNFCFSRQQLKVEKRTGTSEVELQTLSELTGLNIMPSLAGGLMELSLTVESDSRDEIKNLGGDESCSPADGVPLNYLLL